MSDRESLEGLLAAHAPRLMSLAYVLTSNRAAAEDLLQDTLERACRRWRSIKAETAEPYLRRIMVNRAADTRRWKFRRPEVPDGIPEKPGCDPYRDADARDALVRAVRQLPPRQRAVIALRYWADLPEASIATELSVSVRTVKSQLHKALAQLRNAATPIQSTE